MNIILFGAPGAGKGTQGELLAKRFDLVRLSTGDLLRDAVRRSTQLGLEAKTFMDAGELVPDSVILGMVREVMSAEAGRGGFIFDGFPRTRAQAESLDGMLADLGTPLDMVIVLDVDDDVIVRRLSSRRACSKCGTVYNLDSDPPRKPGICDVCGGKLVQRSDDEESTVRTRLEVFRAQTAPLVAYYEAEGTPLYTVNGDRPVEQLHENIASRIRP
ncbi:MAG: adenylate kinase [Longimicrobiales bacterium]